jgi:hypothetical protein
MRGRLDPDNESSASRSSALFVQGVRHTAEELVPPPFLSGCAIKSGVAPLKGVAMMVLAVGGGGGGAVSLATIQRIIWSLRCGMAVGGGGQKLVARGETKERRNQTEMSLFTTWCKIGSSASDI